MWFSFVSYRSLTQFNSIWKEQEKLTGHCLSVKLSAFKTNPAKTRTTSFASCLNLFAVSARVFTSVHSVNPERNFFLFHLINIACDLTDILHLTLYVK